MSGLKPFLSRLLPAALEAAGFAALAHAILVGIAARSIGAELLLIASLSFVVTFVVALPVGVVLLLLVWGFKIRPAASLLLFLVSIQLLSIGLEMHVFEIGVADISWQYAWISVPTAFVAWYRSVFHLLKTGRIDLA